MNRDDIIRMAREAGCVEGLYIINPWSVSHVEAIERFANLVAAAERKACADVCEGHYATDMAARAIRARGDK
jgi:hypothetical protein